MKHERELTKEEYAAWKDGNRHERRRIWAKARSGRVNFALQEKIAYRKKRVKKERHRANRKAMRKANQLRLLESTPMIATQ
jgi:hypothetical protein